MARWNVYFRYTYGFSQTRNCPALMSGCAAGVRNEIHSGVLHLHAVKAASLSEDYVFADGKEGIISEATARRCGK